MLRLALFLVGSIFTVCFTLSSLAANPCITMDCTNERAEELLALLDNQESQIQDLRGYISVYGHALKKEEKADIQKQISNIHLEARRIYENYSRELNIADYPKRITVARRYSAQFWLGYHAVMQSSQMAQNELLLAKPMAQASR